MALQLLSSWCHVAVIVLCLFLMVQWVGKQCVTVVFPGHSHLFIGPVKQIISA